MALPPRRRAAPVCRRPTDRNGTASRLAAAATLLLVADQGYGDVIQFARYIPWAATRCTTIAIACSRELQPVVAQLPGVGHVFDRWEPCPDFAAYCPLSGLPRLAGTRLDSIPAPIPYVRAEPQVRAIWAERLRALLPRGYRRIGIVWAGRPTHRNDGSRSIPLATLAPLTDLPGSRSSRCKRGRSQAEIGSYWGRAPLVNLGPEIRDFADTMAILECLDLVVTVDTAVAHLAGAMGKPVWIMLPYAPDWRWLLDRTDTPVVPERAPVPPIPGAAVGAGRRRDRRGTRQLMKKRCEAASAGWPVKCRDKVLGRGGAGGRIEQVAVGGVIGKALGRHGKGAGRV